ncbi:hypothetical protein LCGC14_1903910 [marine sediment metagenome]|uniref:Uncharacterized protein n=1 Tax=marine sediment metagenome TaxID=412755 RepID=A0A0F9FVP9_9ZZZZ
MGFLYQNWQRWKILSNMSAVIERLLLFTVAMFAVMSFIFRMISFGDFLLTMVIHMGFSLLIQKIVDVKNSED